MVTLSVQYLYSMKITLKLSKGTPQALLILSVIQNCHNPVDTLPPLKTFES